MEWKGREWNGREWNGMEWNGREWNGMEGNGMEGNGMEWDRINICTIEGFKRSYVQAGRVERNCSLLLKEEEGKHPEVWLTKRL